MAWLRDVCARWDWLPACLLFLLCVGSDRAWTQESNKPSVPLAPITIERAAGHEEGEARIVEQDKSGKAKIKKVAPHAVAAWRVRGPYGALVVVKQPRKGATPRQYILRYYDIESGRRRVLGSIPLSSGTLVERNDAEDGWAFALAGSDRETGHPVVLVGDDEAVPGLLAGASKPQFGNDDILRYEVEGAVRSAELGVLLGTSLHAIYTPPMTEQPAPQFLQVFPTGDAMVQLQTGQIIKCRWRTDGAVLNLSGPKANYSVPVSALVAVQGIPAGQRFGVRLLQELSSLSTHEGATVKAVTITPVVVDGRVLIPQGSTVTGEVVQANNVGWGFKHETASLTIHWTRALLPNGRTLETDMRVYQVENAQEKVTEQGKIQGIRSTGTIGRSVQNGVLSFAGIDPIAYIFASAAGAAVLGFAEPEILYHSGTELILENMRPLLTSTTYPPTVEPMEHDTAGRDELQAFVKKLSYRTMTQGSNKPSDITNLVFIGPAAGLQRAFQAAGWQQTDDLYAATTFKTVKTLTGNQSYTQAPMSMLLLDELPPIMTLSKTTNTFLARHHLRIFSTDDRYEGQTVLTSSSTQDIGIAFSRKQKTFIHVIDEHIDNERSKVVNDLMFTGCVESLDMVKRPWVPRDLYNSTGDRLLTDGEAAVLRISDCNDPHKTPDTPALPPGHVQRATRDTALTIRNDLYRGNFIYSGIAGGIKVRDYLRNASELPPDTGVWRKTDASGANYRGLGTNPGLQRRKVLDTGQAPSPQDLALIEKAKQNHKWDPPRYEFALQGGYMHMRESYLSAVGLLDYAPDYPDKNSYFVFLADDVDDGWAAGGSVTVNSWKHFSNEYSYFRQQVKYKLATTNVTIPPNTTVVIGDDDLDVIPVGLVTRQVEYNLLIHPTRPTSRWRPYAAVGPVLQLIALNGAPLKKPAGPFNIGLKNIGLIKAAFDFGSTPPLDGGGLFEVGMQYGAGVKYRVTPRLMLRADFRETWSKNPDIIAKSYTEFDTNDLDSTYTTEIIRVGPSAKFLQDRYTLGVAFTF